MSQEEITAETEELTPEKIQELMRMGVYQSTFFEMWQDALDNHIEVSDLPLDLNIAASILSAYQWLTHSDLQAYRAGRKDLLEQALATFYEVLGDKKDKIYKENKDDWTRHKNLYMELMAEWNKLAATWNNQWATVANSKQGPNPIAHAYIGEVSAILLNEEFGLIEGLKHLKDFSFSAEDREKMNELTGLTSE